MTTEPHPFASQKDLRQAFSQGLLRLLDEDEGMGAFILALANAHAEPGRFDALEARLLPRYRQLSEDCRRSLAAGEPINAPVDDLLVLLKLMALGYDRLPAPEQRRAGPWQLQFNLLRSLRPERAGGEQINQLLRPFNPAGFHFNKPFLASETFWRGEFLARPIALLYNKFPFMPLHGLWVPEAEQCLPQYLTESLHYHAWACCLELSGRIPGLGLGYNSLGAGASINHLHFQLFLEAGLPLEDPSWRHNGGPHAYPLPCRRFDRPESAWQAISRCHEHNIAYNMLYRGERLYLLPRRLQGCFERQPWLSALGWSELCGRFVLFNRSNYQGLRAQQIEQQLRALGTEDRGWR
ncbi:hypothetical protein D5125_10180 [Magnetovirga frankeli]|uniref:hypothetical protein n=1 Tax=Magnetovirga frankeli TaxID=947516 RepID=UPI0012932718|nr:hypothetical protein D5125_10180 [gamma proteobacterium SS-5]